MTNNVSGGTTMINEQGPLAPYPKAQSLAALFTQAAISAPNAVALVLPTSAGVTRVTYAELESRSNKLAAELLNRGVKPGACVALCLSRSIETIVGILGAIKARAAYLPLDPAYPAERLRFMLDDAGAKIVLTDPAGLARVPSHGGETLTLEPGWGAGAPVNVVLPQGSGDDVAYVMYTSGTTGTPKGVVVPHHAVSRLVLNNWFTPIDNRSVFLQLAPISFDAATLEIWGPLLNGGTCVLYPGSGVPDFDDLGRILRKHDVTHLWLTASLFNLIIDERPAALGSVRELLTGGEALSVPHIRRALTLLPNTQLVNGYGPTESTTFACCYRIPRTLPDNLSSIPIGTPIANTAVYVLDEQGKPVGVGVPGELCIGGDGLAQGYWKREQLTTERFIMGPVSASKPQRLYRTGDRVQWKPDGTIEFLGRFDDQVKIRGHRIELGEVAAVLLQHPQVENAVAIIREDKPGDRRLTAYITAKDGGAPTAGALRSFMETRVPDHLIPGAFVVLPRLPLTANGKVDRAALPAPSGQRPELGAPFVAPRTPLEQRLASLWSELLGVDAVGVHDRFFELGGTSILAARFIEILSRQLGHSIPLVALFDAPTVAQIVQVLVNDFPQVVAAHFDLDAERAVANDSARAKRRQRTNDGGRVEIAVVGLGGRFPKAPDLQTFWRNLVEGKEGVVAITAEDLIALGKDPALLSNPDYVPATFALEDVENFDASFFGFSPREAEVMDPQLRLFVETAWTTLEHAGYDPAQYKGRIGVFGGVGRNSYLMNHLAPHPHYREMLHEYHMLVGNERDFPTTHASYRLNLTGPSVDVQTACSTSGVAIHLACQSLRAGDSDMALVGGCKVICPNREGYHYVEGGPLAPEGHIRAFSDDANGMVRGSGSAMLLLKRLDDALADGDTIYGLIKGSALNNDGSDKIGFTAPSVRGQAEVIREALEDAGVTAEEISYVEAHGTGTKMGDPIEIAGLTRAYRETTQAKGYCAIGSVKTNIGHLDAGATAAGVVKTLLAMTHEQLPASLNFRAPNPEIDFPNSPFYVNAKLTPWKRGAKPRRAGVSSFGLGGTNAHIILEEAPPLAPTSPGRADELLVLSARSEAALEAATDRLAAFLSESPHTPLADVAHTLQQGRRAFTFRRALAVQTTEDAVVCLRGRDRARLISGPPVTVAPEVAFMFPGGGAQYANMARGLYEAEAVFRAEVDACAAILQPILGLDIRTLMFPQGDVQAASQKLETPSLALPALFTTEYALARLWMSFGVRPTALIGHSMGEYTAACLAGVMTLEDGLALVSCRGRLFEKLPAGGMLSVPLGEAEARKHLGDGIDIAAVNRPNQCVASGSVEAIDAAKKQLDAAGIESTRIHINVAAHSRVVEPILEEFRAFLRTIKLAAPRLPIISNTTGAVLTDAEAIDTEYWARHLRHTVQFSQGLQTLLTRGQFALVEVGPGQTLSTFARQHPARTPTTAVVSSLRHPQESLPDGRFLASALGKLWVAGVQIDWTGYRKGQKRRRVGLPTYPFERKRHWVDAKPFVSNAVPAQVAAPALPAPALAAPAPVAAAPAPAPSGLPRKDRIIAELQRIVSDLSGLPAASIDPNATFLELGFDSLFLTQANGQFRSVFGVPMTVRQLLEKTPSLGALAARLDAELPATAFPEEAPAPAAAPVALAPGGAAPAGLEGIMQALMALQSQVLALAGGAPAAAPAPAAAKPAATTAPAAAAPDKTSPWQPVQKAAAGSSDGLTDRQRAHLKDLMARVQARTPESKRLTALNRPHLSDPRTVQGFRKMWKDMVYPIFSDRAQGSRIWDLDGNEYIDLVSGYGVTFFGHTPDFIIREVEAQLRKTVAIGPQTPLAGEVTKMVCEMVGMDRAALCNTGSEAVLAAIRMARTVTGKRRLATFSGHYHGIFDEVLVKGVNVRGERKALPISPGIRADVVADVLVLDYGDFKCLDQIRAKASELALVMVEPVRSRNPNNQPVEFMRALRKLTEELGIPLLMDEMVTGFRTHPGGVQALWGIKADLATYGKVVGGGFPIGIVAGSRKYMDALDGGQWEYGDDSQPEADMTWFAGTFVRHPPALAAAKAVLQRLKDEGPALQEAMAARVKTFADGLNAHFRATSTPMIIEYFSSFFVVKFETYIEHSNLLFYHLHNRGVYTYEGRPAFITTEHTDADLQLVADAFKESIAELQRAGFMPGRPLQGPDEIITIPLSEGQQEIWLATRFGDEASMAFNLASTLHFRGNLNTPALRQALDELGARHEALRAVPNNDGQTQRILSPVKARIPLVEVDLSALDGAQQSELAKQRAAEVNTPFDLDKGPLVRARLCKLAANEHLFILTAHHVVADGWSCGVMLRDLGALYAAACAGEVAKLPSPLQLPEWVQQQADARDGQERRTAMDYWLGQYEDTVPVLELPTDHPRPPLKTYGAARVNLDLDADFTKQIRGLATKLGATTFATLLGAFQTMLHRLSGQTDIVVGFSLAGQSNLGGRDLVGHCVNFLPLRMKVEPQSTFAEQVMQARGKVFDAVEHQQVAFGELIKRLNVRRDPSRLPLMSVAFNLDPSSKGIAFGNLEVTPGSVPRRYENFDIFFNVVELTDRLQIQCTYNEAMWDADTMAHRLREYQTLLQSALADASRSVGALPMLPDDERHTLLETWNPPYTATQPLAGGLHARVSAAAQRTPNAIAVVCEGESLTYTELESRSNQLAHQLCAMGVRPDDLVGICLERSTALIVGLLGILKAGGAYVPVDPVNPDERLSFIMQDARVRVLLTQESLRGRIDASGAAVLCLDSGWDRVAAQPTTPVQVSVKPENLAYVIYTSGSTGTPKGVMVEHAQVMRLFDATRAWFNFGPHDVWTMFHSFAFDFSVWEIWGALCEGGKLVVVPYLTSRAPDQMLRLLQDEGVTVLNQTPSAFRQLIAVDVAEPQVRPLSLRFVIFGGEALELGSLRPWVARRGDKAPELINMYGITETTVHVTYRPIRAADIEANTGSMIGVPIPDLPLYIVDAALNPVPIGVPGEIVVGGAGVARGYLNRPELTSERFVPSPFRQGDRLYRSGDIGRFVANRDIEYLGRADRQIKIRGFRIETGEIENALCRHAGVANAAVVAQTAPDGQKSLVAYLVPKTEGDGDTAPAGRQEHKQDWQGKWALLYQSGKEALKSAGKDETAHLNDEAILVGLAEQQDFHEEWIEFQGQTLERINKLNLGDVMEIGCGTGQVLLRVAPKAKSYYGTDFAELGIAEIEKQIALAGDELSRTRVAVREGVDFTDVKPKSLDTVIINSVIQYFPDAGYLLRVMDNAVEALRPGGCMYVGDVQSLAYLYAHHVHDQLQRSPDDMPVDQVKRLVDTRVLNEDELVVDPELFLAWKARNPRVSRVEFHQRRGKILNETTRFHYDVFVFVDAEAAPKNVAFAPWTTGLDAEAIAHQLESQSPKVFALQNVPNARVLPELRVATLLKREGADNARGLKSAGAVGPVGIDPEALWALEKRLPYQVDVLWPVGSTGTFDVVFRRLADGVADPLPANHPDLPANTSPTGFANSPHLKGLSRSLISDVKDFVKDKLPDYMVPAQWVLLSRLPLTANGKLDTKALPAPESQASRATNDFVAPSNDIETTIASVWAEVLRLDRIGVHDNFFEAGGHSLLAVQAIMKLRDVLQVDLNLGSLFVAPTIAQLAQTVAATRYLRESAPVGGDDVEEVVI
ncbi:MAG: amino acid adenylation domain-containing protein [Deltaproteobacteria bacterium]|nr:amino acid adenylation domain-containing protein [Deltaproteobacteria bacterium]